MEKETKLPIEDYIERLDALLTQAKEDGYKVCIPTYCPSGEVTTAKIDYEQDWNCNLHEVIMLEP